MYGVRVRPFPGAGPSTGGSLGSRDAGRLALELTVAERM